MQPSLGVNRGSSGLGIVDIFDHLLISPPSAHLAGFADRYHRAVERVDDLHRNLRERMTARIDLVLA